MLNPRDHKTFAGDLSGRQTLGSKADRSDNAYATGNVGEYVASFDIYEGSFLTNITGGASPDTTITADVSLKPEAGLVDPVTNTVTNTDYRRGSLPVLDSSGYNVGDYIAFDGVQAIGLASKANSNQNMTFKIVATPDANTIEVFPKPIAEDDPGLTALEKAYANINTQIKTGAVVSRVNIDASEKANIFWAKDSIKMIGGEVPWELMSQYDGNQVLSEQIAPGVTAYMVYDGNIASATFRYRIFVWYGLSNFNPMANGVAVTYTT